jgi:hypothetical protein
MPRRAGAKPRWIWPSDAHPPLVSDPSEIKFVLATPRFHPGPELIAVAGIWKIQENTHGKDLLDLDQCQVRNWTPWHRHVIACMLAHAFLAATRVNLGSSTAPEGPAADTPPPLIRSSLAEIRCLLVRTLLTATRGIDHVPRWSAIRALLLRWDVHSDISGPARIASGTAADDGLRSAVRHLGAADARGNGRCM